MNKTEWTEAVCAQQIAVRCGLAPGVVILETRARSTYENAVFVKEIQEKRGWHTLLLVTSSWHMPRAVATFRAQGMEVIPAPADRRIPEVRYKLMGWLPNFQALMAAQIALREYIGMGVYRWKGWIQ